MSNEHDIRSAEMISLAPQRLPAEEEDLEL